MIDGFEEYYIPREKRKKILLLGDDIRLSSGISTMLREIVIGTSHRYNWAQIGGAIRHPDKGKRLDLCDDTNNRTGLTDSSVIVYPSDGYGDENFIRQMIKLEQPDALMFMTDPRYFIWLFQMEHELRKKIPMIYLNIWDDLPYPMYNKAYYKSCDTLLAISKQTENINRIVLDESAKDKIIKYVPHGIDEKIFFPITPESTEYLSLIEFKKQLFQDKEYDFALLFNARNIHRKSIPDLMLAYKLFVDSLDEEEAKKCVFVLHTQMFDDNGTNLLAVKELVYGKDEKYNIIFDQIRHSPRMMNLLYNCIDATALTSSNEGWGLSLTESLMCGKPIIANVTGGMQDQMRFEDDKGNWLKFSKDFGSNHRGKYKKCGSWAFPVFPKGINLAGSMVTPYIFDDRADSQDIADQIRTVWQYKCGGWIAWVNGEKETYETICKSAREWVTSDESMMSSRLMCKNIMDGIDETFEKFTPRIPFELIKITQPEKPKHFSGLPLIYK